MKAQRLPSGNYRVRVTDPITKKRISFTASTKKEAEYEATLYINGKISMVENITLAEAVDEYISMKENILSKSTLEGYMCIRNNNLGVLGDCPLKQITPTMIQKQMNLLSLNHASKTVKNVHSLIAAVLKVFVPEVSLRTTLPPKEKHLKELPDTRTLLSAVIGTDIELPCLLAMWCGMRMSEIRGLMKQDIHGDIILINRTIIKVDGKDVVKQQTKTYDSKRAIKLDAYILHLISQIPEEQDFLTTLNRDQIYKKFQRLLKKHNVPRISFHDLRHVNASVMESLNIPDKYMMERNGWSSPHIMRGVYQHTFTEKRNEVDNVIDSYFSGIVQNIKNENIGKSLDTLSDTFPEE